MGGRYLDPPRVRRRCRARVREATRRASGRVARGARRRARCVKRRNAAVVAIHVSPDHRVKDTAAVGSYPCACRVCPWVGGLPAGVSTALDEESGFGGGAVGVLDGLSRTRQKWVHFGEQEQG